ncbi:hypothetical protein [Methanocella sp. MCL-LM]|uniref:hypothetical protein n=1 Tax=Methanocella sp. MCL-LM TaxID=3412035 RepID=UPI003C78875E
MAVTLKQKGASVIGSFTCKGQFIQSVSRGHSDQADMDTAARFAREMIKSG